MRLFTMTVALLVAVSAEAGRGRKGSSCRGGSCGQPQGVRFQFQPGCMQQGCMPMAPQAGYLPQPTVVQPPIQALPAPVPSSAAPAPAPGPTTNAPPPTAAPVPAPTPQPMAFNGSPDALDELNAQRARRGLYPFQRDPLLTQGALRCAQIRAANRIEGHLGGPMGDFAHLPPGAQARAGGAGALEDMWGFAACCVDDVGYTHAGAAWVRGADGLRYNHIFVR